MDEKKGPLCAVFVCQQCSCQPKKVLKNGRKACVPEAQELVKALYAAVKADPELASKVAVRATRCQGACDKPIAFALNSATGEGWQFGGGGEVGVVDIIGVIKSYLAHMQAGTRAVKNEWPAKAGKFFVARIPAFPRVAKWVCTPKAGA